MRYLTEERNDVKIGLEIHFQLNGTKLFCSCPTEGDDASLGTFWRKLRASSGEELKKDVAASMESLKDREFHYTITRNSCLVEFDEEPPHIPGQDNIDAAIKAALLMNCKILDGVNFMRKIVIDGSNTPGFQRTAILGIEGFYEYKNRKIGIATVCLEEEASRKIEEKEDKVFYSLDRLGIPLIEISTKPDIRTPAEAREVARGIGMLIRRIGMIQKDVDAIRQDLNISIRNGNRVEIKGVQSLSAIETVLENEIRRQESLIQIANILKERGFNPGDCELRFNDLTDTLKNWDSNLIKKGVSGHKRIYVFKLTKLKGLLKNNNFRLGKELAERLRAVGIGGLIHSDELPNYGITEENVNFIENLLKLGKDDAFGILILEEDRIHLAKRIVEERLMESIEGVPAETRAAQGDETRFMRPLPGGARMYPETDIPYIEITQERINYNLKSLPKDIESRLNELIELGIPKQEASVSIDLGTDEIIEKFIKKYGNPSVVASTINRLKPKGNDIIKLEKIFELLNERQISKEAIEEVYHNPEKIENIRNLSKPSDELIDRIREIVRDHESIVREYGESSFKKIMGDVMKEMRGKLDGELISKVVKEEIDKIIRNE